MAVLTRPLLLPNPFRKLRNGRQTQGNGLKENTPPVVEAEYRSCGHNEARGMKTMLKDFRGKLSKDTKAKMFAKKRLFNELSRVDDDVSHCSFGPVDPQDPFKLQAIIIGPSGTPFEGGIFFLSIQVPVDYPFKPPKIRFLTKVYHPNITSNGKIEIDILSSNWTPALTIEHVLLSICSFLPDPNHEQDSCNPVCNLYWKNRQVYDNIARQWTLKYAML